MTQATIYHNPRCSKSRASLALLEQQTDQINVIKYLETPPTEADIKTILKQLNKTVRDVLRRGESEYKQQGFADPKLTDDELINMLTKYPKVLERPIIIHQDQAVIGRPPENVLDLFND